MQVATKPFSEIAWARCSCILNLFAEFAIMSSGGFVNECVHFQLQVVRKLPGDKILISANNHVESSGNAHATDRGIAPEATGTAHPVPGTRHLARHRGTRHPAPGTRKPAHATLE